jgi:hypothetical protein
MKTTANYGLKKPEGTDVVDIQNFNDNADTIDTQLKKLNDNAGALSSLNTTAKNTLVAAINEVFQSGADVKSGTISAVNNKGASLDDDATWDDIVAAINAIARGQGNAVESQVLSGIKFSNSDGQLRTGTMPNKGAITITPSGSAQTIPSGYHNGQGKVSAVTVPVANVLSGTTIAGQAGTMPNKGAVTITPSTTDQAISLGYHNGQGKVVGDANLASPNILKGKSIFNVAGGIDLSNLTPDNVKENVNINGVVGKVEEKLNIQDCLLNTMQNTSIRTLECFIKGEGLWCTDNNGAFCLYDINSNLVKTISSDILKNVIIGDWKIVTANHVYIDDQYIIWNVTCSSVSYSGGTHYFVLSTDKNANIIHSYDISTLAEGACISNDKLYFCYTYGGNNAYLAARDLVTGNGIFSYDMYSIIGVSLHTINTVYYFNNLGNKALLNCIGYDGSNYYSIIICIDTVENNIVFSNTIKTSSSNPYMTLNKLCTKTFF